MCQRAFFFYFVMTRASLITAGWGRAVAETSGQTNRERERERSCLCLPHQGHPFCWIKYCRLIEVGFSLLLFPLHPSFSISSFSINHPPHCCRLCSPSPLLFFTSHSTSLLILSSLSLSLSLPLHPFWGAADAVPMATIGSMFVWYVRDPLITLLAGDNNGTSRPQTTDERSGDAHADKNQRVSKGGRTTVRGM